MIYNREPDIALHAWDDLRFGIPYPSLLRRFSNECDRSPYQIMRLQELFSFSRSRSQNRSAASLAEESSLQSPAAQTRPALPERHGPRISPDQGTERPLLLSEAQLSVGAAPSFVRYQQNELNLWASARSRLPDKDKATISKFVPLNEIGTGSMPSALLQAVQAKRKICEKNHWNFQYKGRTIRLQDAADRVLIWMEKFKAVGDIAVNADPVHAGLPWAGIRLLLQVEQKISFVFPQYADQV